MHRKYLINLFFKKILFISLIFLCLVFIMNLFEEVSFFKDISSNIILPLITTTLNAPSILYLVFPFIFLISAQLFFIELFSLTLSAACNNSPTRAGRPPAARRQQVRRAGQGTPSASGRGWPAQDGRSLARSTTVSWLQHRSRHWHSESRFGSAPTHTNTHI